MTALKIIDIIWAEASRRPPIVYLSLMTLQLCLVLEIPGFNSHISRVQMVALVQVYYFISFLFRYDIQGRKHVQSVIHSTLYVLEVKALVLLSPKIFNYLVSYISAGCDFSSGDHLEYLPG